MIIPSVDIQGGQCVQLIGGDKCAIMAGDPEPWVKRFSIVNEVAVIDIDAAKGKESNAKIIKNLAEKYSIRVGGGIRDYESAANWLDSGAVKVIIGTAAEPELLKKLPRDRTIVALDTRFGNVQKNGWTKSTGKTLEDEIRRLSPYTAGFLITTIEREGQMTGLDLQLMKSLVSRYPDVKFTLAGGTSTSKEIAFADESGVDVQVGMALYTGKINEDEVLSDILSRATNADIWPTVVCDESGIVMGLVYSNKLSLSAAIESAKGIYWSRRRGLWRKGETSGNTQLLLKVSLGCNRDSLKFTVRQEGKGFCHTGKDSCFADSGEFEGFNIAKSKIYKAAHSKELTSYTQLLMNNPALLDAKIREEAEELIEARTSTPKEVLHEVCDLLYFSLVKLMKAELTWADVERSLARRTRVVTRRYQPSNVEVFTQTGGRAT